METRIVIVVKWLGHASFIVKAEGQTIYIDPYEGEYHEKANLVLVTHSHHDHCDSSQISKIRGNHTIIVAPADCASTIGGQVRTLKPGEKATFGPIAVTATAAYNSKRFRSPGNPYHPKGFGVGYLITAGGKTVYHAGDTDRIPEMDQLGKVDLALLPSGGTYTMDNNDAVEAALAITPKVVIPMHRWDTDPAEFKKGVKAKSTIKVVTLNPGAEFKLG
jgi:L-ascorbate metabolism protein UlaG (beta-lactamase superfamily)